ncbi:NAD-dependent epimerase/dehydratase family protein [Beduini massiliensis]|uniref:NAD-dependent epimerase/dehydratase family protein n=1 Tax=Beduini massiliensis TaxID=1585974 RepID=UPI00059AA55A|nr:NAD(P)-dependent oxidoreductase [Beduini massiliensis]
MSKILVTGANGYIGAHVVKEMYKQHLNFIATDYDTWHLKGIQSFQCNLFNEENIYENAGNPEVLLHLAWRNGFVHNDINHMKELSFHYTFITNMIEKGIKHICVMGSMHEIGYYEGVIDESTPTHPMSQYAVAKNALRQSLEIYCKEKGVIFQWIRGFYIYGDDTFGNSIFAKLQQANKDGKTTFPFTTGKNKYDFISIDDLAKQIVAVVKQDKINGIINCCSGKPVSLADQVEWYIKEYNLNLVLKYGAFPDREYDSPAIWGDNTKITKILGESHD